MYNNNNIFAKIIRKEITANIIYEDDKILSFHDISNAAPIHALIIPKGQFINYNDFINNANNDDIIHFFKSIDNIANLLQLKDDGYRIITNIGPNAHQTIEHYHVHILGGKKLGPLLSDDNLLR